MSALVIFVIGIFAYLRDGCHLLAGISITLIVLALVMAYEGFKAFTNKKGLVT